MTGPPIQPARPSLPPAESWLEGVPTPEQQRQDRYAVAAFEVTRTAVSQHLTVLKNAGLLTERRDGTRRLYRARPEGLAGLRQLLDHLWAASLDAARQLVEAERGIVDDEREAAG